MVVKNVLFVSLSPTSLNWLLSSLPGAKMDEFKRAQEAKGSVITGQSLGPITKV